MELEQGLLGEQEKLTPSEVVQDLVGCRLGKAPSEVWQDVLCEVWQDVLCETEGCTCCSKLAELYRSELCGVWLV